MATLPFHPAIPATAPLYVGVAVPNGKVHIRKLLDLSLGDDDT